VKGAVEFMQDGRAIITAFENADASTAIHELGHILRRDLIHDDKKIVEDWVGVVGGRWTREAEEKFDRAFERYIRRGEAPTEGLRAVFAKLAEVMRTIYRRVRGSDIDVEVTADVKRVFDRLLTGQQQPQDAPAQEAAPTEAVQ